MAAVLKPGGEPVGDANAPPEDPMVAEARRADKLRSLGDRLHVLAREQVQKRQPIEDRMMEDLRQYHGRYDYATQVQLDSEAMKGRSKVFANITRSKTNAAEARVSDMLFPADDKNWGIGPTPVPELSEQLNDKTQVVQNGQPLTVDDGKGGQQAVTAADLARRVIEEAKRRSSNMAREIDDQLTEAHYNIEARKAIHQAAVLGTGVLKGPVIVNRARRRWKTLRENEHVVEILEISEAYKPSVEWVDTWNYFPEMAAASTDDCEFEFERKFLSKKKLRELAKRPGFLKSQIREVLKENPRTYSVSTDHLQRLRELSGVTGVIDDSRYEMWEYHGPIEPDELRAAGIAIEDDDPLKGYEAIVLFIGPYVIRADINPMETGDRPYSVFNWEGDDGSIFGYGIPFLMRTPQRIMNGAYRMMMDNAGVSVGDQVVVNQTVVSPADGDWTLRALKLWLANDKTVDVTKAFTTFSMDSHQAELSNIIKMASQFADEETALPMLAQGEKGTAPDTVGGMSILMNAANVVLRRIIKNFDDYVTKPIITRFYDWNMQFSKKTDIKGDFQVDARGTTALLVKELQSQSLMTLMGFAQSPVFGPMGKWADLFRKSVESMALSPDEIVKTDEQIETEAKNRQPEQDPRVIAEGIKRDTEIALAQQRSQDAEYDRQARLQEKLVERDIEAMRLAAASKESFEKIKARLAEVVIVNRSKEQLFAQERQLKLAVGSGI